MESVISAIRNTISISLFNKGQAGKIFEEVKVTGPKVVMKNNNAECVLLSPEEYTALIDEVNDLRLFVQSARRLIQYDPSKNISLSDVDKEFGFTQESLAATDDAVYEIAGKRIATK